MAGRTYRSIWSRVATAGSQDGGVAATQPSALVTRPICSWTSTCCSEVRPPPPSSAGMFVAYRPSSRARLACAAVTSAGSSPPDRSASSSNGIRSSANPRARAWIWRSSSDNPYMRGTSRRQPSIENTVLTECSVYVSIDPVPMSDKADAVVVGGGTVGAWCAYFLRQAGLSRVVLIEKGFLGQGASSRAAGVVRMQGGTPEAVRLGIWSRRFYLGQRAELGTDSGFVSQGYLLPCFTAAEVEAARERLAMQSAFGIGAVWLDPDEVDAVNPALAPGQTLGGTFCADDGYISPPRNVAAYTVALLSTGVTVAERVAFRGLLTDGGQVRGVTTSDGEVHAPLVVLTGGPKLAQVGALAGIRIPAGGVRHQVAVTEQHPDLHPGRVPMVFDLSAGLYWRPEEGGLLFGMSNPDEQPGENRSVDLGYLRSEE